MRTGPPLIFPPSFKRCLFITAVRTGYRNPIRALSLHFLRARYWKATPSRAHLSIAGSVNNFSSAAVHLAFCSAVKVLSPVLTHKYQARG
jgi:hypothetical protein